MMEPALDEGSSNAAEQAAQHLADVLLPIDATTQLAALPELERHHTFVSACCERADVVLASALFRDLSQAFEKLAPLPRFSLYLALLQCAARDFRRKLGDVDASEERWLRAVAGCVAVVAYLRQGIAIAHDATTDALLTAIGDAELTAYREDITTFAASLYCVCVGLAWVAKPSYDDRIAEGLQLETPRDGRSVLLGRHEDGTAAESCVYDFAHALSGKGFALTKAEIKTPYVITHLVQCRQVRICDALVQPVQCCVCLEDTHRFDRAKFLPCKHSVACYTCAAKLQKSACPTCAAHITEVVAYARHDELGPMRAALGGAEPVISWEAVIAHAHTLALEVQRLRAEVHTTTPGLKAAEARAKSLPVKGATHLKFVIDEATRPLTRGGASTPVACTACIALEDALAMPERARRAGGAAEGLDADELRRRDPLGPCHVKHVVQGRRKCHLRMCPVLEAPATKFLRCSRCKDAHYCSRKCQEADWKILHHRRTCGKCPAIK